MRERIEYLDVVRIIACFMIVLMHSPHPNAGNPGFIVVPLSFITASGIGLFFMVSGALLLGSNDSPLQFIRKRLSKVVFPTLFWSFFYLGIRYFQEDLSFEYLLKAILSIPFSAQGHGILWFMYVLIGLYFLTPILSAFLRQATRQEIRIYLILWAVSLCYPFLSAFVGINESPTGILYYFTGYAGYYVLGYYLKTYVSRIPIYVSVILVIIPIIALGVYYLLGYEGYFSSGRFWYLSILVGLMCVGWYSLLQRITSYAKEHLNINWEHVGIISNCCFGVYLMHIFIMRNCLWNSDFIVYGMGGIGQILSTWILTLITSFILTYLISFLPLSDYLIGYKHKSKISNTK